MKKNIIFAVGFALILAIAWVYFVWQGGEELRELNKDLPEGIRVVERNGGQVVVNEKDGYEITVPEKWGGLESVNWRESSRFEKGIVSIEGKYYQLTEIKVFSQKEKIDMEKWVKELWKENSTIYIEPEIVEEKILNDYERIKANSFGGMIGDLFFIYIQINSNIYEFSSDLEEIIQDVILNINFDL